MNKTEDLLEFNFSDSNSNYLTHSIHPYPAKFPPILPRNLLLKHSQKGDVVLDPFCGSGTTLVEARILGIHSIGVDVNGLSTLLSKVKTTPLNDNQFKAIDYFVTHIENTLLSWEFGNRPSLEVKQIEGLEHWFQINVAEELTYILNLIDVETDKDVRDFLKIILSAIIVRVSNQDSDTRFAAIEKNIENSVSLRLFTLKTKEYILKLKEFSKLIDFRTRINIYNADSRDLKFIADNSVDIIVTSPPYANTYDYYLYHKFRKRWLDLDVKFAQYNEIGSRREYSSLKKTPDKWNNDLILCFIEMSRVLKKNHLAFIVIGDSVIDKKTIKMNEVISSFAKDVGFEVKDILSTDLSQHSKIFNPSFSQKGKKEHLITLEKI